MTGSLQTRALRPCARLGTLTAPRTGQACGPPTAGFRGVFLGGGGLFVYALFAFSYLVWGLYSAALRAFGGSARRDYYSWCGLGFPEGCWGLSPRLQGQRTPAGLSLRVHSLCFNRCVLALGPLGRSGFSEPGCESRHVCLTGLPFGPEPGAAGLQPPRRTCLVSWRPLAWPWAVTGAVSTGCSLPLTGARELADPGPILTVLTQ